VTKDEALSPHMDFYDVVIFDEFAKSHHLDDEVKSSRGKARES